jgi:hypothetical protein
VLQVFSGVMRRIDAHDSACNFAKNSRTSWFAGEGAVKEKISELCSGKSSIGGFWAKKEVRALQQAFSQCSDRKAISEIMATANYSRLEKGTQLQYLQQFRRNRFEDNNSSLEKHPQLLWNILRYCQSRQCGGIESLCKSLDNASLDSAQLPQAHFQPELINGMLSILFTFLEKGGQLTHDALFHDDEQQVRFDTIRYSREVGYVAFSTTTVYRGIPGDGNKLPTFRNIYRNRDSKAVRVTEGVVVLIHNNLYFLGGIHSSKELLMAGQLKGIKLMAMQCTSAGQEKMYGMVLSSTTEFQLVCGRISLIRLDKDDELVTGKFLESDLLRAPEVRGGFSAAAKRFRKVRSKIKNEIKSKLADELEFDGKPMAQNAIAGKVAELCRRGRTPRFMIVSKSGEKTAFNPADDTHTPFNQALSEG